MREVFSDLCCESKLVLSQIVPREWLAISVASRKLFWGNILHFDHPCLCHFHVSSFEIPHVDEYRMKLSCGLGKTEFYLNPVHFCRVLKQFNSRLKGFRKDSFFWLTRSENIWFWIESRISFGSYLSVLFCISVCFTFKCSSRFSHINSFSLKTRSMEIISLTTQLSGIPRQ